jgi:hypothetical protein
MSTRPNFHRTRLDGVTTARRAGRSRAAALFLIGPMSLVLASVGIAGAAAQTTRPAAAVAPHHSAAPAVASPRTSQFCTFAENTSKADASASALAFEMPATMAAAYTKLKAEEPAVIAAAPSQIKGDFKTLFTYVNKIYAELASVKYNFLKLPHTFVLSLESGAAGVAAAGKAIEAYLTKTCGLKP